MPPHPAGSILKTTPISKQSIGSWMNPRSSMVGDHREIDAVTSRMFLTRFRNHPLSTRHGRDDPPILRAPRSDRVEPGSSGDVDRIAYGPLLITGTTDAEGPRDIRPASRRGTSCSAATRNH